MGFRGILLSLLITSSIFLHGGNCGPAQHAYPGEAFVSALVPPQGRLHGLNLHRRFCRKSASLASAPTRLSGATRLRAQDNMAPMPRRQKPIPIPVVMGNVGGRPLLPGGRQRFEVCTDASKAALEVATTFAAMDTTFASRPLLIYLTQAQEQSYIRGIATLVTVDDAQVDEDGKIYDCTLAGVGRAFVDRIRVVNQTLIVADQWIVYNDEIPPMSYRHSLDELRTIADQASAEHNRRRALMASLTSKTQDLQLCGIDGTCDTEALLALGPDVYAKAMELSAKAISGGGRGDDSMSVSYVLSSLEALTEKSMARSLPWDTLWPQWGDEIDDEMRQLRTISFSAWRTLESLVSNEEMFEVLASRSIINRLRHAKERLYRHRVELEEAEAVLVKVQGSLQASAASSAAKALEVRGKDAGPKKGAGKGKGKGDAGPNKGKSEGKDGKKSNGKGTQ